MKVNKFELSLRYLVNPHLFYKEMKLLPVFKNYSIGSPSSRLYLKNLAKSTTDSDLKHIYGNYVMWDSEEERNMYVNATI